MTDRLSRARQIYVDTNICIYLVQGSEPFQSFAERALSIATENDIPLISSELAFAECLYGVVKTGQQELEPLYRKLFSAEGLVYAAPVDLAILEQAARLGGESGLKLLDSIHLATALQTGCDVFLTNDKRFRGTQGLRVFQLADLHS
jgi:predicted nucleic acid-binding protein